MSNKISLMMSIATFGIALATLNPADARKCARMQDNCNTEAAKDSRSNFCGAFSSAHAIELCQMSFRAHMWPEKACAVGCAAEHNCTGACNPFVGKEQAKK